MRARQALPDFEPNFRCTVMAGRRAALSPAELESLRQYNQQLLGIEIRTYDWLVDAALSSEAVKVVNHGARFIV